ncbi:hypothetical protein FAGKG844_320043 [Frankia sp. AgKG'84/4]
MDRRVAAIAGSPDHRIALQGDRVRVLVVVFWWLGVRSAHAQERAVLLGWSLSAARCAGRRGGGTGSLTGTARAGDSRSSPACR